MKISPMPIYLGLEVSLTLVSWDVKQIFSLKSFAPILLFISYSFLKKNINVLVQTLQIEINDKCIWHVLCNIYIKIHLNIIVFSNCHPYFYYILRGTLHY